MKIRRKDSGATVRICDIMPGGTYESGVGCEVMMVAKLGGERICINLRTGEGHLRGDATALRRLVIGTFTEEQEQTQ